MPKALNWVTLLWNPKEPWSRLIYVFSISSILITIGIPFVCTKHSIHMHNLGISAFIIGDIVAVIGVLLAFSVAIQAITRALKN